MDQRRRWPLPPDPDTDVVLDAKGLRALAHPVRLRLLRLLRMYGPSTATRLAERLGLNSGATSYHLRRLAGAGLVEEEAERGNARERWWRSVHRTTWFDEADLAEREPEATVAFMQSLVTSYTLSTQEALSELPAMPRAWREVFAMSDWALRLTPEEAQRMRDELWSVILRYRRDTPEATATAPADAERVMVITHLLPQPDVSAE
jgi:DNA-binding transcriptional ArsR family regulator